MFVQTVAGAYAPAIKGRVEKISGSILRLRVDGQDQDLDERIAPLIAPTKKGVILVLGGFR